MIPQIIKPFSSEVTEELRLHVREIRRAYDAPGAAYHDANHGEADKFNRWFWHNLPLLVKLHHDPDFIKLASDTFKRNVKPSYVFLSMYGPDGVCPLHTDRPQCQFTIDWQLESDGVWPIFIDKEAYILNDGEAVCYSGTGQPHYREKMTPPITFMNLAFFHFVPTEWVGCLT